jgi:primosomal protein N' (replication factor Y)
VTESTRIARVAVPVPLARLFDYQIPGSEPTPAIGSRVQVPFSGRKLIGLCTAVNPPDAHEKLKNVYRVLDQHNFLGDDLWRLAGWLSDYYQYPLGEVIATLLPAAARSVERLPETVEEHWQLLEDPQVALGRAPKQQALYQYISELGGCVASSRLRAEGYPRTLLKGLQAKGLVRPIRKPVEERAGTTVAQADRHALNAEQEQVVARLVATTDRFAPTLLNGITGSGKTEVYLRFIEHMLEAGSQVLVLVPEIALTPQTVARFEARFGRAEVVHSGMTDRARLTVWLKAQRGELKILIGTRSAVLTPFARLGLIVVDEEHDSSFKQQEGLRYSARDVAVKRAQLLGIPLVLGSATPSFESLHNVASDRYQQLNLTRRAGGARMPTSHLIDLRGKKLDNGLAQDLLRIVSQHLNAGGQVLVFLNRRGFAPTLLCGNCGWRAECPACERPMTMHRSPSGLICHHCGRHQRLPDNCPACERSSLIPVGQGTQRVEAALKEKFPDVPVYRIDRDTVRSRQKFEAQLKAIHEISPAILIGTQMLAKGHHFPEVTLVAVINADGGFLSPDFRAPERTAQLITQVAGRAGRAERPGEVYIQTYQPDNPLLTALLEQGYQGFAREELNARQAHQLPPFRPIALLRSESADASAARQWLIDAKTLLPESVEAYGPAPAIIERVADRWRFQVLITASDRGRLHSGLRQLHRLPAVPGNVRFAIDIDPYDTF